MYELQHFSQAIIEPVAPPSGHVQNYPKNTETRLRFKHTVDTIHI